MENIKITMLGASGTGKTCFMVGMYATMRQGVKGFTFTTSNLDDDLDLSYAWDRMVETQDGTRWPESTVESKPYSFEFCYGLKGLLGFDWLDYRGGALKERSTDKDVAVLMEHLKQSTCIFLCVSAEELMTSVKGRETAVRRKASIDRMLLMLQKLPNEIRPAIVIVITKFDKLRSRSREEIIDEVKTLFNPLFVRQNGWFVMICPVTLGTELGDDPNGGTIEPLNIHLPVTFSIYYELRQEMNRLQERKREAGTQLEKSRKSLLTRLFDRGSLNGQEREIRGYSVSIEEAEERMKLLVRELIRNASVYYEDRKVELDV